MGVRSANRLPNVGRGRHVSKTALHIRLEYSKTANYCNPRVLAQTIIHAMKHDQLYRSLAPNLSNGISQYLLQARLSTVFHHDLYPNRYRQGQNHNDVEDCHCNEELPYVWIGRAPRNLRNIHPVYPGNDRDRCKALGSQLFPYER